MTVEWMPINAVRGHGMLIETERVGLYNMLKMTNPQGTKYWGVFYLILTAAEWERAYSSPQADEVLNLDYFDTQQPETATVTRSYLTARELIHGTNDLRWIGKSTPWRDEPYDHATMQALVLEFHHMVKQCLES